MEKPTSVAEPQQPQRALTAPGRPLDSSTFARSLSSAEEGTVFPDSHGDRITEKTYVEEPRQSSLLPGQPIAATTSEESEAGGATQGGGEGGAAPFRSGSAPDAIGGTHEGSGSAAEQVGALRQRRPHKGLRSESAPAAARVPSQGEPAPGLVRNATKAFAGMLEPKVPIAPPPGWRTSCMNIVKYSWLNVLLIFVPVSWIMHFTHQSAIVTFVTAGIAIIPLAALLGFATEDLALRIGETLGGLLNATFGNAVELIIAILALVKGELDVVQSSMIGSLLSNCLLVLGMCYVAGGFKYHELSYAVRSAQININMLVLAIVAFIIPVAFHAFVEDNQTETLDATDAKTLKISHGVAILLLISYLAYLSFTLWTHSYLYAPPEPLDPDNPYAPPPVVAHATTNYPGETTAAPPEGAVFRIPSLPSWGGSDDGSSSTSSASSESTIESHEPQMSGRVAICLLMLVTVVRISITGVTAEWLVSSIEGLVASGGVSEQFVALILLPIIGNAAEHVTAVTVATKNKLDLSMAVAVGSSIQIALFVIPVLVLLGWCIGQPLTFYFDELETVILFLSIIAVAFATGDGRTNWLEGFSLMMIYVIIAVVIFFYDPTSTLS